MERIFIAFGFNPKDRAIVGDIELILRSFGILPDGGEILGGEALDSAILAKIKNNDGLIAVLTRREGPSKQRFSTWVQSELIAANTLQKHAIAFVEKGLKLPSGLFSQNERIDYDPEDPLPAFLKLVRIIGEWKRTAGRRLKAILLPDELAQIVRVKLRDNPDFVRCEYRFIRDGQAESEWQTAVLSPEVGGTLAYLRGAKDDLMIEMRIKVPDQTWTSAYSQQWTHVRFEKKTGDR